MQIITAASVELELASGVWTDMYSATVAQNYYIPGSLKWNRGVGENRVMQTGSISFSLDNASEVWTPGNTSSTHFNKLVRGIGVRYSTTFGSQRFHFRGKITDIQYVFPEVAPGDMRVDITADGETSFLGRDTDGYNMATQQTIDVDNAIAAVMTANGSALYSLVDSDQIVPWTYPRAGALGDIIALAATDPKMLLFEDGLGRVRLADMTGGNHASPAHTWGSTTAPIEDITPDWRHESQFAQQSLSVANPRITETANAVLYRHPFNVDNGYIELMPAGARWHLTGRFDILPVTIANQFSQTIAGFTDSGDDLGATMDAAQTVMTTQSNIIGPNGTITFAAGDDIMIDQEIMRVTAATNGGGYQNLTIIRAQNGTLAAAHTWTSPVGRPIFKRSTSVVLTATSSTVSFAMSNVQTFVLTLNHGSLAAGHHIAIDLEVMLITSIVPDFAGSKINVTRAQQGSTAATHAAGKVIYLWAVQAVDDVLGPSYIKASTFANGNPATEDDIVGIPVWGGAAHITATGREFIAAIWNQASSARYLADLVIGGVGLEFGQDLEFTYRKAIPFISGLREGESLAMPYGTNDVAVAKGYLMGSLRAGRMPTPWLPISFHVASTGDAADLLAAEIGDLVRYTGTGTNREKIDDWYRIMAISGDLPDQDYIRLDMLLAPSHLWRNPSRCFYTNFSRSNSITSGLPGLNAFEIQGVGMAGWTLDSQWTTLLGQAHAGQAFPLSGVAAPVAPLVNVGSAEQVVEGTVEGLTSATSTTNNNWNTASGGVGVVFRANSAGTQRWEAGFNRTNSTIVLQNTAGASHTAAWTPTAVAEISVRARANRIQVYVDCKPEPVIDIVSTTYQTNTYAGIWAKRIISVGSGSGWGITDFYAHAL